MQLDLTTFVLEIVNFLILVWILKRFLYRPVAEVVERRKAAIRGTLEEASQMRQEAETMREQYTHRLAAWEQERKQAHDALQEELTRERGERQAALTKELAAERDRAAVRAQREREDFLEEVQETAYRHATAFASRLLARLAGPELEQRLVDLMVEDIGELPQPELERLREQTAADSVGRVITAFPLGENQRHRLQEALQAVAPQGGVRWSFEEEPGLLAGVRVQLGAWTLQANLQDELAYFAAMSRDEQ